MQVKQAMSNDVRISNPNQSIREAAAVMAEIDAGVLPVGENDRLVGMITDRDIAIRAVAAGKAPTTSVREVMSKEVDYCFEDDDIDDVAQRMADAKLRRMPVSTATSGWSASSRWATSRWWMVRSTPAKRCAGFPSPAASIRNRSMAERRLSAGSF